MATPIGKNQYGDDIYNTPNGAKTGTQITQELRAANWNGVGDPVAVYNQTASQAPIGGPGRGTGGGTGNNGNSFNPQDQQDFLNGSAQSAGFSRDELAEKARQFNAGLAEQEKQWERDGLPRLEIDQRAQALREWQAQQDISLQRSQLGLSYLTQAAQMGGPASVFQQADFLRGARQRGDVPGFLGNLAANTQLPAFTGGGNASIIPQTPGGLTLQLGGAGGAGGGNQSVTLPTSGGDFLSSYLTAQAQAAPPAAAPATTAANPNATATSPMLGMHETFPEGTWIGLRKDLYGADNVKGDGMVGQYVNGVIVPRSWNDYVRAGAPPTVDMSKEHFAEMQTPAPSAAAPAPAPAAPVAAAAAPTTPGVGVPATTAGLGTDPAGYSYDAALNQIGSIFRAGPTSLTPGSLEKLDPNELAVLKSGATKLGYDPDAWLRAYQRAGVGQSAGAAA